jgi:hypothetical protein
MKYSFSVFLVPKVANRESAADIAVQFVRIDEASEEELTRLEKLNVLIREKQLPISNLGWFKLGEVVKELCKRVPYEITVSNHTNAWKFYKVRPLKGDSHPERTRPDYCVYDDAHEDHVYTPAWVEKLVEAPSDSQEFEKIVGHPPRSAKLQPSAVESLNLWQNSFVIASRRRPAASATRVPPTRTAMRSCG